MKTIINSLSRKQKIFFVVLLDILSSLFSTLLTLLVFVENITLALISDYYLFFLYFLTKFLILFQAFGLYRQVFRYFNFRNIINIIYALISYILISSILIFLSSIAEFNIPFLILQSLSFFMIILISRLLFIYLISISNDFLKENKVFIYGINKNSVNLSNLLENTKFNEVVAFIEDDKRYKNSKINTIPVKSTSKLDKLISELKPHEIILSDKYSINQKREIISSLEKYNIRIRLMPDLENISDFHFRGSISKPLSLEDLVDRKQENLTDEVISIDEEVILVTGAGGSIGSEIVRQLCTIGCKRLILVDNCEFNLFTINKEILNKISTDKLNVSVKSILVSVKDKIKIDAVFKKYKPDLIFHAAAYKHVGILEENIIEAIENNFLATRNLVDSAIDNNIKKFCFISTDKAVNPKTVMGFSKRMAELYIQASYKKNIELNKFNTLFSIVRFGNVFNSSGSVIPLFNQQILNGGPITVTSEEVERYFMSITEAVRLVLQSTKLSDDCSIFVLDMGTPIKIIDIARRLIRLSGLSEKNDSNKKGDIEISITGISSYEKLTEELSINKDLHRTDYKGIYRDKNEFVSFDQISNVSLEFERLIEHGDTINLHKKLLMFN